MQQDRIADDLTLRIADQCILAVSFLERRKIARRQILSQAKGVGSAQLRLPLASNIPQRNALGQRDILLRRGVMKDEWKICVIVDHEVGYASFDRTVPVG